MARAATRFTEAPATKHHSALTMDDCVRGCYRLALRISVEPHKTRIQDSSTDHSPVKPQSSGSVAEHDLDKTLVKEEDSALGRFRSSR
jgi:hypothetical protein